MPERSSNLELESSDAPASPAYFPDGTEQEREVAAATPYLQIRARINPPLVLKEVAIHGFPHHHLFVKLDQEVLRLLMTHASNLRFKGTQTKLLF